MTKKKLLQRKAQSGFPGFAVLVPVAVMLVFASCPTGEGDPPEPGPSSSLDFDSISRMAYMGGSLMYNPNGNVPGQLAKDVVVATRFTSVDVNYTGTGDAFGYIVISSVDTSDITFSYTEYDDDRKAHSKGLFTVGLDKEVDITGDDIADVTYSSPAYKRDGMENAVWLTFISPMPDGSSEGSLGMYSVLPERYARAAYPNSVMGITPDGRFVVSMYENGGARAAVQGVEYGDIVVDSQEGKYKNIKSGSAFRSAAQRMGDDPSVFEEVGDGSSLKIDVPDSDITDLDSIPEGTNDYNTELVSGGGTAMASGKEQMFQEDQFNNYATPEKL